MSPEPSRVLNCFDTYRNMQVTGFSQQKKMALSDALGIAAEATAETYISALITKLPNAEFPDHFTEEREDGSRHVDNATIILHDSWWRGINIELGKISVRFFYEEGPTPAEQIIMAQESARARNKEENWLDFAPELSHLEITRSIGYFTLWRIADALRVGE